MPRKISAKALLDASKTRLTIICLLVFCIAIPVFGEPTIGIFKNKAFLDLEMDSLKKMWKICDMCRGQV